MPNPSKQHPRLNALFFKTSSGNEPVREWLKNDGKVTLEERKLIGADISYVQFKWPIGKPQVDHLDGGVWEVRTNLGNRTARILFAVESDTMVLLHGFIKKTRATDRHDIELAQKRLKDWKNGQGS